MNAIIEKYFEGLTDTQQRQFDALATLYKEWNEKINVISRKDIDLLYERHVLHSLGIAKIIQFAPQTEVMDVGTGGGFPGVPLAILFPEVKFYLVDSIGKKIKVVEGVCEELGLNNVEVHNKRAEQMDVLVDFVVSRAVTEISPFYKWVEKKFSKNQYNSLKNGILYLKGGDLEEEFKTFKKKYKTFSLSDHFEEEFFETKKVVYIPLS